MFLLNVTNGQTDDYLQIIHERHEQAFPSKVSDTSRLNRQSEIAGYKLVSIVPSPCNESLTGKPIKKRIANKSYIHDLST